MADDQGDDLAETEPLPVEDTATGVVYVNPNLSYAVGVEDGSTAVVRSVVQTGVVVGVAAMVGEVLGYWLGAVVRDRSRR